MRAPLLAAQTSTLPQANIGCDDLASSALGMQGIFGAGVGTFSVLSHEGVSALEMLLAQNDLAPMFSLHACRKGALLMPGGLDPSRITEPLHYTPMVSSYFGMTISDILLGNASLVAQSQQNASGSALTSSTGIWDSGTNMIVLPAAYFSAVTPWLDTLANNAWGVQGLFSTPGACVTAQAPAPNAVIDSAFPPLSLMVPAFQDTSRSVPSNWTLTMPASQSYLQAMTVNGTQSFCNMFSASQDASMQSTIIFGGPAQITHAFVYNAADRVIGFAKANATLCDTL